MAAVTQIRNLQLTEAASAFDRPRPVRPRCRPAQQLIYLPRRCLHPKLAKALLRPVQRHCRMRSLVRVDTNDHACHVASKVSTMRNREGHV